MRHYIFTRKEITKALVDMREDLGKADERNTPLVNALNHGIKLWQDRLDQYEQYVKQCWATYGKENCTGGDPIEERMPQAALWLPFLAGGDPLDLIDLARYFALVITDGDWANDFLTHLPPEIVPAVQTVGEWVANILY